MVIEPSASLGPSFLEPEKTSGPVCGACILNAATTGFEAMALGPFPTTVAGTNARQILEPSIIFFTAYSISTLSRSNGLCVTTAGPSVALVPELSITKPAAADPTAFGSSVTSLFSSYLRFSSCNGNAIHLEFATDLVQGINATSNPLPTNTAIPLTYTTSPSPAAENISPGLTAREKTATGVVVPVITIIAFVLGMIYLRRRRRKQSQSDNRLADLSEENQPYLQQKAELEVKENRRLELEAVELRYEMDGGFDIKEMSAWGNEVRNEIDTLARPQMPSLVERHELRGEDCSKELEAP